MADRVTFTADSADRIAKVVRIVEAGNRDASGTATSPRFGGGGGGGKVFRVCTYTGAWSIGSENTVTFKNQTSTPNTAIAKNLFLPLPDLGTRDCAIAKEGTAWYLIQAQFEATAFVTDATLTTAALQFNRYNGLALGTASTVAVSVTTCATTS